jgi:glycosyltransferase involved in cell wall biosynthesis
LEKIVIIPTYNERENILAITEAVFALQRGFHVLVIDDNSPDGTAQLVEEQMQRFHEQLWKWMPTFPTIRLIWKDYMRYAIPVKPM